MKKSAVIVFLLFSILFYGQENKSIEDKIIYEKGMAVNYLLYEDYYFFEKLNAPNLEEKKQAKETYKFIASKALSYFNELILYYPDSDYYLLALFEKGKLELNLENKKVAKEVFLKVLNSETTKWKYCINESLLLLAALAIEEKNYEEAKKYLDLRKKNGLNFFCGVEREITETKMKNMYEKIQEGLKKN